MKQFRCFSIVLFVAAAAAGLFAQSERGSIAGSVLDPTGAVIPGARINVTHTATNVSTSTTTTDAGVFTVPALPVGSYNVRVEKEGFKPAVHTGVVLNAATTSRVDITLEVGTAQQAIEVQADSIQLQTESAKSSTTITNKLVDELPLVVGGALRSPFDLALLTPEAKNFGDNSFIIGGGQAASFGTTLDGVSANTTRALQVSWVSVNAPSLEAITEFTVDSNGFKAEYGHAGGGAMTFASKSGSNELHGSLYEFIRNDAFDARRFFEARKGVYKQHDFGGALGGPIWIPKLYNGRNKSFFFTAYEGFRNRVGADTRTVTVPSEEMYGGDFHNWVDASGRMIPIYNPFSQATDASGALVRDPFPGNVMPRSLFDPLSVRTLGVYQESGVLKPNNGAAPGTLAYVRNNYRITQGTVISPQTKFSVKGDHLFSEKNRISGYYGYARTFAKPGSNGPSTLPGYYTDYNDTRRHSDVFRMSWDHTFGPTMLNHFYAGGNNWRENHDPPNATVLSGIQWKDKVCMPNVPNCDENLVNLRFSDYQGWGGPANNGSENTIYSFNDDLTWIKGKHSIKLGGMFQRNHYNGFGRQDIAGRANFSFTGTGRPGDTNFTTSGGNAFAAYLLGWTSDGGLDTVRYIGQQWPYFAGYIQDDWRITQKFTLNLGVRWETTLPPVESKDRWSDFSPTRPNPKADNLPGALIYAGSGDGREGSRTLADSYFKSFGPRIGFAYSLNDKTVIRASYARSFGTITTVTGSTHQRGFTLTQSFPDTSQGLQPSFLFRNGLPAWNAPPFVDPSFSNGDAMPWWQGREATRPPENNAWNVSIQRQLSSTLVLDLSYNALIGSHLQAGLLQYNQLHPRLLDQYGTALLTSAANSPQAVAAGIRIPFADFTRLWGSRGTVAQALRPYPQYQNVDTLSGGGDHSGHSSYHAGIIKLEKRYGSGLTFQTSYVFSKLLTDTDSYWASDFQGAMDHYNRGLEKSIGSFDVTHNFKLGLVYDLPFGKGRPFVNKGGITNAILGGWRLSNIHYYASGRPMTIATTIGNPLFSGRKSPNASSYDGWRGQTKGEEFDPQTDRIFQPASFFLQTPQNPFGFGNITRFNPNLREFASYNENISVAKSFQFTERLRLDFRWEAFNLFNRVRFGIGANQVFNQIQGQIQIQSPSFGLLTGNNDVLNDPRRMQFGLKLYW